MPITATARASNSALEEVVGEDTRYKNWTTRYSTSSKTTIKKKDGKSKTRTPHSAKVPLPAPQAARPSHLILEPVLVIDNPMGFFLVNSTRTENVQSTSCYRGNKPCLCIWTQ